MSAFVLSWNHFATGYLALNLGVWLFATKAHVDQKCIFSRFGFCVSDSTTRDLLNSLTDSSLQQLREQVAEGILRREPLFQIILDNVQQYSIKRERTLVHEDELIIGTAATAVLVEDCALGAFDLKNHLDRVVKKERLALTVQSLYNDIDWKFMKYRHYTGYAYLLASSQSWNRYLHACRPCFGAMELQSIECVRDAKPLCSRLELMPRKRQKRKV